MINDKYFLKKTKDFFIKNSFDMEEKGNGFRFSPHVYKNANMACTITTRAGARMDDNFIVYISSNQDKFTFDSKNKELKENYMEENLRIRKLTPRECFRLMGLEDSDIDKIINTGLSDSSLYKLAGNSIVKNVLDSIHINLFK